MARLDKIKVSSKTVLILEHLVGNVTACCIIAMAVIRVSLNRIGDMYDSVNVPADQAIPEKLKSPPKIISAPGNCDLISCRESL